MLLVRRIVGVALLVVGVAVFAVRLGHAGPYAVPADGNLRAALAAFVLAAFFLWRTRRVSPVERTISVLAWVATPIVLFFGLYATLAEIEEVVVVESLTEEGDAINMRLWVVDAASLEWVNMPRAKAVRNGLTRARVGFFRDGETLCREATMVEDRSTVVRNSKLASEKYAIKRLATWIGVFSKEAPPELVTVRLAPCEVSRAIPREAG